MLQYIYLPFSYVGKINFNSCTPYFNFFKNIISKLWILFLVPKIKTIISIINIGYLRIQKNNCLLLFPELIILANIFNFRLPYFYCAISLVSIAPFDFCLAKYAGIRETAGNLWGCHSGLRSHYGGSSLSACLGK